MSMYAKIRRMHLYEKVSINEIARRTSLSRNTIRKWLKEPERSELKYARTRGSTKLDPYLDEVRQALATDADRPKLDRRTLLRLFAQIKSKGYDGGYSHKYLTFIPGNLSRRRFSKGDVMIGRYAPNWP